ncbi:Uu.00g012320.m01.CDS01 [Anthostomella pinea]|uniref:Uu.00g012320.m01.CDS01 n=1 Tax=Anthostomella pinea TaxID=933095 RepID=A0AAI8YQ53_9PEZI|nr:Uu.00g012320.m01.CDS01 [Anthostomella pinea]
MASLAADMSFEFIFPSCEPVTPPSFSFDPSLLEIPYNSGHARTNSYGSIYSSTETSPSDSVSTRNTTPSRSPPPIRQHGPILLPKIRSQDQAIASPAKRVKTSPTPTARPSRQQSRKGSFRPAHNRSFTNPETLNFNNSFFAPTEDQNSFTSSLLCSPITFAQDSMQPRRASSVGLDGSALEKYGFPTYRQMPSYAPAMAQPQPQHQAEQFMYNFTPRAPSPLSLASTPDPTPSTTLMNYLTSSNPAPSLVRTISFPLRDPNTKHFWWDVRQIRPWTAFNLSTILSLPGASGLLHCPVPSPLLQQPLASSARHPETEAALHNIYASYYIPKLNAALALSSTRALQLSVPSTHPSAAATKPSSSGASPNDHFIVVNAAGESSTAAAMFGGKPTARAVGLVKSFDRFNTGMRVEGNVKRVEYLRGLAHLHHAMREHGTRYGFILTEIELVVVRNGGEATPHFGYLEVASVQLATSTQGEDGGDDEEGELTACLALWGLCMMAADESAPQGQAGWRAEIGAPAEGTRRKALPRDEWMPQPQLAEKREAKRARGWVSPEDPVGRKELGKRGVRYGGC